MATLVSKIIDDARALLNTYTDDGVVITDDEMADFIASCVRFADLGQKEMFRIGNYKKTIEYTNYPTENQLGDQFDAVEYVGDVQYYPNENGIANINSYKVEADKTHTITIQELESGVWADLVTISGTSVAMTAYKGNLTPTTVGNKIRMKMSGSTYYIHRNRALFKPTFDTDNDVPDYAEYVLYTLPSDFKMIDKVIEESKSYSYTQSPPYNFESPNRFYIDYNFKGVIRVVYIPIPTTITAATDTLEIDDIAATALAFYVASWRAPYENKSMVNPFFQKYTELLGMYYAIQPAIEQPMEDEYGGY